MEKKQKDKAIELLLSQITIISLDSYIEKVFYDRCVTNTADAALLLEWAGSKEFYCRHTNLTVIDYGSYSKHDCSHSVSILDSITAVIGKKRIKTLTTIDLWLLLHCAYAHDIGMPYSHEEAKRLWESLLLEDSEFRLFLEECLMAEEEEVKKIAEYVIKIVGNMSTQVKEKFSKYELTEDLPVDWSVEFCKKNKYLISEFVRRKHAKRTKELIENQKEGQLYKSVFSVETRFYYYIAKCSMLHGENFEEVLKLEKKEWYRNQSCHPAFVAAMLRLGDLLDIDNKRFDEISLQHYGTLPKTSAIHKKKHEAITHILYTPKLIEITAESDELEVCQCAEEWFGWIRDEVTELIFSWNQIAPECLGGCQFSKPNTKVYFKGNLYLSSANPVFHVEKDMLLKLVIGRNLYRSELDFIREYIQNAMDAVKMKLWMEIIDGDIDWLIKEEYRDLIQKLSRNEWLPFYINEKVFEQNRLEVICRSVEGESIEVSGIEVTIKDHGIGIDEECVEAISYIGSGWRKRKKYTKYLANMPKWLKPTGGFGIGVQSGFMITDKVEIYTRCENMNQGWHFTFHSPTKGGKIEKQKESVKHIGTTVTVRIPYLWFLDGSKTEKYDELERKIPKDFFRKEEIKDIAFDLIKDYISKVIGNSLFPIRISCDNHKDYKVSAFQKFDSVQRRNSIGHYEIFELENGKCIWDNKNHILIKIDVNGSYDEKGVQWYYKGVRVWKESPSQLERALTYLGKVQVDIMDEDVQKYLTVDRNSFASDCDMSNMLTDVVRVYFESFRNLAEFKKVFNGQVDMDIKPKKVTIIGGDSISNTPISELKRENCFRLIYAYIYIQNNQLKNNIKTAVSQLNNKYYTSLGIEYMEAEGGYIDYLKGNMLLFCQKLWEGKVIYIAKERYFKDKEFSGLMEREGKAMTIYFNDSLYNVFESFKEQIVQHSDKQGILQYPKNNTDKRSDIQILNNAFEATGGRKIYYFRERYPELYVSKVPGYKIITNQDAKQSGLHMVISPLSAIDTDPEIIKSKLKLSDIKNPQENFVKLIMGQEDFEMLVEWVFKYQYAPNWYTRNQIRDKYKELLEEIFDKNKEKLLK